MVGKKRVKNNAQKYITSLFLALSEDVVNSKENLKNLVKESQTPKGLNEQGVKELTKAGFYKSLEKTLNSILKTKQINQMSENILEINNLSKYFGGLAAVSIVQ